MSSPCAACEGKESLRIVGLMARGGGIWKGKWHLGSAFGAFENIWQHLPVHPVEKYDYHEHESVRLPAGARDGQPVGWFEVVICRDCKLTRWFAREADALHEAADVVTERCDECGDDQQKTWVQPVRRGCGTPQAPGTLETGLLSHETKESTSTAVCRGCGDVRWVLRDLEIAKPGYWNSFKEDDGVACARCGDVHAAALKEVREGMCVTSNSYATTFPLTTAQGRVFESRHGCFRVRICRGCGDIVWRAEKLDGIEPDPSRGIFFDRSDAVPSSNGPYR